MYKNLDKVVKIINQADEFDNISSCLSELTKFDCYSKRQNLGTEMVITVNRENHIIKDGPLFKIFIFYDFIYNYDDFEGPLEIFNSYLKYFNNEFNFLDLANEIDEIINIRKQYNMYNSKVDDICVKYAKQYFKDIHNLLLKLS